MHMNSFVSTVPENWLEVWRGSPTGREHHQSIWDKQSGRQPWVRDQAHADGFGLGFWPSAGAIFADVLGDCLEPSDFRAIPRPDVLGVRKVRYVSMPSPVHADAC